LLAAGSVSASSPGPTPRQRNAIGCLSFPFRAILGLAKQHHRHHRNRDQSFKGRKSNAIRKDSGNLNKSQDFPFSTPTTGDKFHAQRVKFTHRCETRGNFPVRIPTRAAPVISHFHNDMAGRECLAHGCLGVSR